MHTLEQLRSGALHGISRLDLSAKLSEFPEEIFTLADSLEVLNLSGNRLRTLPDTLPRLTKLKVIFCSENLFTELPEILGQCPALEMVGFKGCQITQVAAKALPKNLRWLILTDNAIRQLPDALGHCTRLQKLMLSGNQLRALPDLSACQHLELIRLAANQLTALPAWLGTLPRLAWLAYAGNPVSQVTRPITEQFAEDELALGELLGQGASGMVYQALHKPTGHALAVKCFKGRMTSDGLPANEVAAVLTAGTHANLIKVLGTLDRPEDVAPSLVLERLPADYQVLAGPPSLASCTRDIYPPEARFSQAQLLTLAAQGAAVLTHLHQRGIMHGDFYAHNLLLNAQTHLLLSDFGAATLYAPEHGAMLERLEVCGFGYWLEELAARAELTAEVAPILQRLIEQCSGAPLTRPTFAALAQTLTQLTV